MFVCSFLESIMFAFWMITGNEEAKKKLWLTQVIAIISILISFIWFIMNGQNLEWWAMQGSPTTDERAKPFCDMADDPKQADKFEKAVATNEKIFAAMAEYANMNPTFGAISTLVVNLAFASYFLYVLRKFGSSE